MTTLAVPKILQCKVCLYIWTPRKPKPKACPDCKSRAWDKPYMAPTREQEPILGAEKPGQE